MASKFDISITAVDKATKTIRDIRAKMEEMTRPVTNMRRSLKALGGEIGLDKLGKSFVGVTRHVEAFSKKLLMIGAPITALIGGGTLAGLASLTSEFAKMSMGTSEAAASIGISSNKLLALRGAAAMAGVEASTLDASLKSMGQTLQDAAYGRNQTALMFMSRLGLSFHKTKSGAMDVTKTLEDLSKVINNPKIKNNPQVQATIARMFGVESLMPMLRKGPQAIAEYQKKIEAVGYKMTDKGVKSAEEFAQAQTLLQHSITGTRNAIAEKLIPIVTPLIERLTNWITANRGIIASRLEEFVKAIADWLKDIDFEKTFKSIDEFLTRVGGVVGALGGWRNILIGIIAIKLGGFIGSLISMGTAIYATVPAFVAAATAAGTFAAALLANPVTWILAAVAALAAAVYLVYDNWEAISEFFRKLWEDIKSLFKKAIEFIGKIILDWTPLGLFLKALKPVKDFFENKLPADFKDSGKKLIERFIEGVMSKVSWLKEKLGSIGATVKGWLGIEDKEAAQHESFGNSAGASFAASVMGARTPGGTAQSRQLFAGLEEKDGLPKNVLDNVWRTESGRGKNMLSKAGAKGHFQFMDGTAERFGVKNPYDLAQSATGASKYLKTLLARFGGNIQHALTAYNWGEGNMSAFLKTGLGAKGQKMPDEARAYAGKVLGGGVMPKVAANSAGREKQRIELNVHGLPEGTKVTARDLDSGVDSVRVNYGLAGVPV